METVAVIIGAFFLFLAGIPLIGAAVGFSVRVLLPYLFGGGLIYFAMQSLFDASGAWWEIAIPLFSWAALVLGTRFLDTRAHDWHEGHWRSVFIVVTFGLWRRSQLPTEPFKVYEYRLPLDADQNS